MYVGVTVLKHGHVTPADLVNEGIRDLVTANRVQQHRRRRWKCVDPDGE